MAKKILIILGTRPEAIKLSLLINNLGNDKRFETKVCVTAQHREMLDDVLNLVNEIKPKKTILTNLNNDIDYSEIKKILPKNVIPAYDGLSFYF